MNLNFQGKLPMVPCVHDRRVAGFTLLELIIVIVIIGVLVTLALPRFSRMIEVMRATEAINNLNSIRRAIDRCQLMGGLTNPYSNSCLCAYLPVAWASLDIEDPGLAPNAHFYYEGGGCGTFAIWAYKICAYRNSVDGGNPSFSNKICLKVGYAGPDKVEITGGGVFSSIKQ